MIVFERDRPGIVSKESGAAEMAMAGGEGRNEGRPLTASGAVKSV